MAETTNSLNYAIIRREIGRELGWPRDPASWSSDQIQDAADMIASGTRVAYYPADYEWRFLKINFSFSTADNQREYPLPADCAALVGTLTYEEDDGNSCDVRLVSEVAIRQRYQVNTLSATGFPIEAAIRFERPTAVSSSRTNLVVWPEPDGVYTINGQCIVQPNTVTSDLPYPYGGPAFHECLLNAILMQCERKLGENDGKYANAFAEQLVRAKKIDMHTAPDHLGYNGDPSNSNPWTNRNSNPGRVTYVGME